MKQSLVPILLVVFFLLILPTTLVYSKEPVNFPDENLKQAIRDAIDKPSGDIYPSDLEGLTELDASGKGVKNLGGLSYCVDLKRLNLRNFGYSNVITDLSPIADLKNLRVLGLGHNDITDLSPLNGLTNLEELDLWGNKISDISPISDLVNLVNLSLGSNNISDLSPLSNLINLKLLNLAYTNISGSDLASLTGLTKLEWLSLASNGISDISSLSGLTNLRKLYLWENDISDISPISDLMNNLVVLHLEHNNISDLEALSGITNPPRLYLDDNEITDLSPLSGLTNLQHLYLDHNNISDISPLSGLTNLDSLSLGYNDITNISPLSGLTDLSFLYLGGNDISDLSPLSDLTNLVLLDLGQNNLSDIQTLAELTELRKLRLNDNQIKNIGPLSNLTKLGDFPPPPAPSTFPGQTEMMQKERIEATVSEEGIRKQRIKSPTSTTSSESFSPDLNLRNNNIIDIQPLVDNSGLGDGDEIDLRENYLALSEGSEDMQNIQSLIDRGATVEYEPQKSVKEGKLVIVSPLDIVPRYTVYGSGNLITAQFSIINKGDDPIDLKTLTVGGRDPDDQVVDFNPQKNISLKPGESQHYIGNLKLPEKSGNYHFFCTYQKQNGTWITSIELSSSLTNEDRVEDIEVASQVIGPYLEPTFEMANLGTGTEWGKPDSLLEISRSVIGAFNQKKLALKKNDREKLFLINSLITAAYRIKTTSDVPKDVIRDTELSTAANFWNTFWGTALEILGGVPAVKEGMEDVGFDIAEEIYMGDVSFVRRRKSGLGNLTIISKKEKEELIVNYNSSGSSDGIFVTIDRLNSEIDSGVIKLEPDVVVDLKSSAELRVYGSNSRVTGIINGKIKERIPTSLYLPKRKIVKILESPNEKTYKVVGTQKGTYVLEVNSKKDVAGTSVNTTDLNISPNSSSLNTFTAIDIPTSSSTTHQYTADWKKLSQGEDGVTIKTDNDGDGTYEETTKVGNAFSGMEAGTNVKKEFPNQGIALVFDEVTSRGFTDLNVIPKPDFVTSSGIHIVGDTYKFDTTATFSENVELTLSYSDKYLSSTQEESLKLYKISESGEVTDIIRSADTDDNTITGTTDSFSYFAVGYPEVKSLASGWELFSPPGIPLDPDPSAALGDDIDPLTLYYDYSPGEGYTVYPSDTPDTQLNWSQGYWLYLDQGTSINMDVTSPSEDLTIEFTDTGWKQIGVPYNFDWSQLSFSDPKDFETDGAEHVRLVSWDPTQELYLNHYSDTSYVLDPWRGYWIKVKQASTSDPATITVTETNQSATALGTKTPLPQSVDRSELDYPPLPQKLEDNFQAFAYPNPITEQDQVTFTARMAGVEKIKVTVTNPVGKVVYDSGYESGRKLSWDLRNSSGSKVANGIYLYKIQATGDNSFTQTSKVKKLLVLR